MHRATNGQLTAISAGKEEGDAQSHSGPRLLPAGHHVFGWCFRRAQLKQNAQHLTSSERGSVPSYWGYFCRQLTGACRGVHVSSHASVSLCSVWQWYSFVGILGIGWWLDSVILHVFSNLNDSVILLHFRSMQTKQYRLLISGLCRYH